VTNSQDPGAREAGESMAALIAGLSNADDDTRLAARAALVHKGEAAVPALSAALRAPAWLVRWEAAKALGEIQAPSSAPALVRALEDQRFGVRWLAAEGLIDLGAEGLRPLLDALLADPDSGRLREGTHHVLKVLAERGLRELVANVVAALEEPEPDIEIIVQARAALAALSRPPKTPRPRHSAPGRTRR